VGGLAFFLDNFYFLARVRVSLSMASTSGGFSFFLFFSTIIFDFSARACLILDNSLAFCLVACSSY